MTIDSTSVLPRRLGSALPSTAEDDLENDALVGDLDNLDGEEFVRDEEDIDDDDEEDDEELDELDELDDDEDDDEELDELDDDDDDEDEDEGV